jgi:hypothetical protein
MIVSAYAYGLLTGQGTAADHRRVRLQGIGQGLEVCLAGKPYRGSQTFAGYVPAISG